MRSIDAVFCGLLLASAPTAALACACGCAVFDVGTSSLIPGGPGGTVFMEYDFLDQTKNWSGTSSAPSSANDDKNIRSNFWLLGGQYMFNEDWGAMVELPYTQRRFTTADPDDPGTFDHGSLGDIRLMGVYSGFEPDMSLGIIFGLKLPTGDSTYPNFDPDTEIGSGSTDLLLGAYKAGALVPDQSFSWFGQVLWQHEVATRHGYTPGSEFNAAFGASYEGWRLGPNADLSPLVQAIYSHRGHDGGSVGEPDETGYNRLILSPGLSLTVNQWKLYADAEFPVYQDMTGNQLVAPVAYKFILSYSF